MSSTALRVKELLRENGWTTKVLAEKTGISESYLTHIKNGTRRWNEDALKKIAEAFNTVPVELFVSKGRGISKEVSDEVLSEVQKSTSANLKLSKVPMLGDIPEQPSVYNNQVVQVATGYKGKFVPALNVTDPNMFCLCVESSSMLPRFSKGDSLLISPASEVKSGDVAAVEYRTDKLVRGVMITSFMDEFIVLESVNHKSVPVALVKGKDHFRVIGKVIYRYQRL
ncbi:helix-turn-helix transcriptional regulator [bacterium]|nr:helix-turn-helix transcriptional regulator [bacterium]